MKRLVGVLLGIVLFAVSIVTFNMVLDSKIVSNQEYIRNLRTEERFWSRAATSLAMDENTLLILGSSELSASKVLNSDSSNEFSPHFCNSEDMNVMTLGDGNFQSLSHAIALGAMASEIPSKTVALILSPQWFSQGGIRADAFASKFSEDEFLGFLANGDISQSTKQYVMDRTEKLLVSSPTQHKRIEKYCNSIEHKVSLDTVYRWIMTGFWKNKAEYSVVAQMNTCKAAKVYPVDLKNMDWEALYERADSLGREACTNNDFGIMDSYWDMYVQEPYLRGEVTEKKQVFVDSAEYDDLKCFLNVAEECGIRVLLVNIPVNEKWYYYEGELCDEYYEKIRGIANSYENVSLIDMSEYASEPYFLKDIMHLGWKGWVRVNEALYKEFKK